MRIHWIVIGAVHVIYGASMVALAFGASGAPAWIPSLIGSVGGACLTLGSAVLFFEWKDRR